MAQKNERPTTLLEDLFRRRDAWRKHLKTARDVVRGDEIPLEINRMGLYRWYTHPAVTGVTNRNLLFWLHEIPPGSRSGKQKHQGGRVHFVWEGHGYTVVDGVKHDWEQGDLILIPIKPDGCVFQHFNADHHSWVKLVVAEPNYYDALGVDLGCGFEQLEDSPDYQPQK